MQTRLSGGLEPTKYNGRAKDARPSNGTAWRGRGVMPNPTAGDVSITIEPWQENSHYRLEVMDQTGRTMLMYEIIDSISRIHLPIASGMYPYRIIDSSGRQLTHGKLVVIHN
jgi:hypothetical protein